MKAHRNRTWIIGSGRSDILTIIRHPLTALHPKNRFMSKHYTVIRKQIDDEGYLNQLLIEFMLSKVWASSYWK